MRFIKAERQPLLGGNHWKHSVQVYWEDRILPSCNCKAPGGDVVKFRKGRLKVGMGKTEEFVHKVGVATPNIIMQLNEPKCWLH